MQQRVRTPGHCCIVVFFFLLLSASQFQPILAAAGDPEFESSNVTLPYLRRTIQAVNGALAFFSRNFDQVNLDAVIGTRIVEGTLKVLLDNLEVHHQASLLPKDILNNIRALYRDAKQASNAAEPHVAISQPKYYQRIGPTIYEGMWELDYPTRALSPDVRSWRYTDKEFMTELESDDCLTELFGTAGTKTPCSISEKCWRRMTSLGYSQYSLSHQIFYLQLGERSGCLAEMKRKVKVHGQPSLHALKDTFCSNMLREAEAIARARYPATSQDLFMEQGALCGMYGYWELFRYDWLERMLSWQDAESGCYKWLGWQRGGAEPLSHPQGQGQGHKPMGASTRRHHVVKREERQLADGCLCHRTTVAAGGLVQYIRYLVEAFLAQSASLSRP